MSARAFIARGSLNPAWNRVRVSAGDVDSTGTLLAVPCAVGVVTGGNKPELGAPDIEDEYGM